DDGRVLGIQSLRPREGRGGGLPVSEDPVGAGLPGPGLRIPRLERRCLVVALQGLWRPVVLQEELRLCEPGARQVPFQGDRTIVILDRSAPSTLPLQELSLPER